MKDIYPICSQHDCELNVKYIKTSNTYNLYCKAGGHSFVSDRLICEYCYSSLYFQNIIYELYIPFCSNPECFLWSIVITNTDIKLNWNNDIIFELTNNYSKGTFNRHDYTDCIIIKTHLRTHANMISFAKSILQVCPNIIFHN